jgi:hypothetical protein
VELPAFAAHATERAALPGSAGGPHEEFLFGSSFEQSLICGRQLKGLRVAGRGQNSKADAPNSKWFADPKLQTRNSGREI